MNTTPTTTTTLTVETEAEANILSQLPGAEETVILSVEETVATLVETLTEENTAYGVWKILTGTLTALGIEKTVPSQMMYNYTRNGLIAKGKKGSAKEIRYTKDEVTTFVTKYVNKYSK